MRYSSPTMLGVLLAASALTSLPAPTASRALAALPTQAADPPAIDTEVAALYKQMTAAYMDMKSYSHTAVYTRQAMTPQGAKKQVAQFQLAMERPNKFLFKSEDPKADAVMSDGKTFINYRNGQSGAEYIKKSAPDTFKGINIVDDVMFEPQGTYLVALALRGDVLADKDMTAILSHAKMGEKVQENGKTYQTAVITDPRATMTLFVEADTHRLSKIVQKAIGVDSSVTEVFKDVQINKSIDPTVFKYTPPASAKSVAKFSTPENDEEAQMKAISAKFEGKSAPDFTALDRDGKEIKLSSFKGKVVVVDFWASWCGPCRMVMPTIQAIHDKYKNVVVMAVDSWDEKKDCDDFLKSNPKYTMPVVLDPLGAKEQPNSIARKLYGAIGIPTTIIIDKNGIISTYAIGAHEPDFYFNALKKVGVQIAPK